MPNGGEGGGEEEGGGAGKGSTPFQHFAPPSHTHTHTCITCCGCRVKPMQSVVSPGSSSPSGSKRSGAAASSRQAICCCVRMWRKVSTLRPQTSTSPACMACSATFSAIAEQNSAGGGGVGPRSVTSVTCRGPGGDGSITSPQFTGPKASDERMEDAWWRTLSHVEYVRSCRDAAGEW